MKKKDVNDKTGLLNTIHAFLEARKTAFHIFSFIGIFGGLGLLCTANFVFMLLGTVLMLAGGLVECFIGFKRL